MNLIARVRSLITLLESADESIESLTVRVFYLTISVKRFSQARSARATRSHEVPPANIHQPPVDEYTDVLSEFIGIFHPSVTVGQKVKTDDLIGTIYMVKVPQPVESPVDGVVEQILIVLEEGAESCTVEFGQPLVRIRHVTCTSE